MSFELPRIRRSSRRRDERGVALIVVAISMVVLLIVAALAIDVGRMRSRGQAMQSAVDFAALSASDALGKQDISTACQQAVDYFRVNVPAVASSIDAKSLCTQAGNDVTTTTCSGGTLGEAKPSATASGITLSIHYPVPDSEITSPGVTGARINDGIPCQRMRVVVTDSQVGFFSGVAGHKNLSATRSATIRVEPGTADKSPALWLLDPVGCVSLNATGNAVVTVGNAGSSGLITVDSDGSACSSNQNTVVSTGTTTKVTAVGTGPTDPGKIALDALPKGATVCSAPACDPADVSGGRLTPQPVSSGHRATRALVDAIFNCKSSYPNYHGVVIAPCTKGTPAYLDNLRTYVGPVGTQPPGTGTGVYQDWKKAYGCKPNGNITVTGNWWINCPDPQGFTIQNGTNVTFSDGNVVMDGGLSMSGGTLSFNTGPAHVNATLPAACQAPLVTIPCINQLPASTAAIVYERDGSWNLTGGTINAEGVTVIQQNGYLKMSANPPTWHAPTEGPFKGLAYWSELSSSKFSVQGGAGADLSGIFFAPEAAPFTLTGGGNWGQQHAQFITYQLSVNGGAILSITPDQDSVQIPNPVTTLIR
jgi:hypothetical protein